MEHKAFHFEWGLFEKEFLPFLSPALKTENPNKIIDFIESSLNHISDPYNGNPLTHNWKDELASLSIQHIADYALTKYYSVNDDFGLGDSWVKLSDSLLQVELDAFLGNSLKGFDPGCYGSYFQSPEQIKISIDILSKSENRTVKSYVESLSKVSNGLYVTF